ncbi:methyltransferase, putative [Vulgatibacter incomptus]|uniref:Methyltransferase, putative n=1 Tax=Vulgatibacter incomptus TaxID=1391653 RepID=A0A0K1PA59_9BACT|nr:methyltransferase, putative [Vulgatibacter incomptus]
MPGAAAPEARGRREPLAGPDGKPWWESYFGPDYPLLYPEKTRESGEAEVRSILAALALRPAARILDVGCGAGRHVLALAKQGYRVTGLDRSPELLASAASAREAEGLSLELRLADMRSLPLENLEPVDAVLSMFTSFGYFSEAENEQVARGMAASLVPGGRLFLDLNNRELLQEANGTRTWAARPGGYLLDEFGYDTDLRRFHGRRILLADGRERRYVFDHRAWSEQEIRGLLKKAGLRVLAVYGTLERTPFNLRAPRMVVLAEKP